MKHTLEIYNHLRTLHAELHSIDDEDMDDRRKNALDALDSVFYLAEGVFANEDN